MRVLGAIGVIEIEGDFDKMIKLRKSFVELGVFLRPFSNCIYIMPALNVSKSDLKKIIDAAFESLSKN